MIGINKITKYSYCTKEDQWFLYKSHYNNYNCDNESYIMHSTKTPVFDISTVFNGSWLDAIRKTAQLVFCRCTVIKKSAPSKTCHCLLSSF